MGYEVRHGRVQTWSLETQVADHCNLRCAQCCQLSPHFPERFVDPDALARDLERAATALEPLVFKLTGGEPLLHPALLRCLEAVRACSIAPRIQVTTNGLLAANQPDAFFEAIDRLKVSLYSSAPLPQATLARIEARCAEHEVELSIRPYASFQELTPHPPFVDAARARAAFDGCWLKSRCHTLDRGRFYVCSRPPRLTTYLAAFGHQRPLDVIDGVELDGPRLLARVLDLLERDEPLASCSHCLGASGAWSAHRQLGRDEAFG
jgi:cyclic pyranopterin phosphate synthase